MDRMSDKTFGVKVSEELYEKVKDMIDVSGISSKEWFEKAVAMAAVQNLKSGAGDYKPELSELEIHTTRIYELISSMIQRSEYMKMDAVKGLEGKLDSREIIISELQGDVKKLADDSKLLEEQAQQATSAKKELVDQVESFQSMNENNQALITEYKEKIDTLSSLVNQYKGFATENEELKTSNIAEKEQMKAEFGEKESRLLSSIEELKTTARDQATSIEQLQGKLNHAVQEHKKEIEDSKAKQVNQLTQLADKKELEKERAVLEIERKYQAKLENSHDQYNEKLTRLYEKLDRKDTKGVIKTTDK